MLLYFLLTFTLWHPSITPPLNIIYSLKLPCLSFPVILPSSAVGKAEIFQWEPVLFLYSTTCIYFTSSRNPWVNFDLWLLSISNICQFSSRSSACPCQLSPQQSVSKVTSLLLVCFVLWCLFQLFFFFCSPAHAAWLKPNAKLMSWGTSVSRSLSTGMSSI